MTRDQLITLLNNVKIAEDMNHELLKIEPYLSPTQRNEHERIRKQNQALLKECRHIISNELELL